MSFIAAGAAIVSAGVAIAKMVQGKKQADQARVDENKAKQEMNKQKDAFASMDTTNPYLNMENTMEDLTVNKQQAEFQQQQSMQSQANIMQQMRGAAGGSGIAALAQTMAQQGSMDAQRASASIGQQEARNQQLERQEASRIQGLERQGEGIKRNQQFGKISGMMGMAAGDLEGARARIQTGQEQQMTAAKDLATTATDVGENYGWWDGQLQVNYGDGDTGLKG
tara:strand:- start:134 stop:805 length:672 start_codon:yes stop_codon:yes gene_type:complete